MTSGQRLADISSPAWPTVVKALEELMSAALSHSQNISLNVDDDRTASFVDRHMIWSSPPWTKPCVARGRKVASPCNISSRSSRANMGIPVISSVH